MLQLLYVGNADDVELAIGGFLDPEDDVAASEIRLVGEGAEGLLGGLSEAALGFDGAAFTRVLEAFEECGSALHLRGFRFGVRLGRGIRSSCFSASAPKWEVTPWGAGGSTHTGTTPSQAKRDESTRNTAAIAIGLTCLVMGESSLLGGERQSFSSLAGAAFAAHGQADAWRHFEACLAVPPVFRRTLPDLLHGLEGAAADYHVALVVESLVEPRCLGAPSKSRTCGQRFRKPRTQPTKRRSNTHDPLERMGVLNRWR